MCRSRNSLIGGAKRGHGKISPGRTPSANIFKFLQQNRGVKRTSTAPSRKTRQLYDPACVKTHFAYFDSRGKILARFAGGSNGRRFVEGVDRGQTTLLFPECLEDWIRRGQSGSG